MARSSRHPLSVATISPRRQWQRQSLAPREAEGCLCSGDLRLTSSDLRPRCDRAPIHAAQGDTPCKAKFYVTPTKQRIVPHAGCHTFSGTVAACARETLSTWPSNSTHSAKIKWDTVSLNFARISLKTKYSRTKEVGHFSKAEVSELKDALALQKGSSHSRMLEFQLERI